jgi:hypothetical protein
MLSRGTSPVCSARGLGKPCPREPHIGWFHATDEVDRGAAICLRARERCSNRPHQCPVHGKRDRGIRSHQLQTGTACRWRCHRHGSAKTQWCLSASRWHHGSQEAGAPLPERAPIDERACPWRRAADQNYNSWLILSWNHRARWPSPNPTRLPAASSEIPE